MSLNNNALTTVDAVVSALGAYPFLSEEMNFNDADVVAEIERLINSWSAFIEKQTGRTFGLREYVEMRKGSTQPTLVLRNYPIKTVTSVDLVGTDGTVMGSYDVTAMQVMMDDRDLLHGILYIEPSFYRRNTTFGVTSDPYTPLRSMKVTYDAGFVLPKDATDEIPSDLPSDLESLVIELCKEQFLRMTDAKRAQGMVMLVEGNVQRQWDKVSELKLTKSQEKILKSYKSKVL